MSEAAGDSKPCVQQTQHITHESTYINISLSLSLHIYIYIYTGLCIYPSIYPSIHPSLSFSLSLYIYIYMCMGFYFVRVMELYYEVVFAMHAVNAKHRIQRKVYQEEPGSVRFVSVTDFSTIDRFSSVRFGKFIFPVRRGSACVVRTRRGSIRFVSVRFRVRFRPVPEFNGLIRFGSAGSVRFLIPSCHINETEEASPGEDVHKKGGVVHLLLSRGHCIAFC